MSGPLGRRVRALRRARGLRIRELAAAADAGAGLLSRIERGVAEPDEALVRRLASCLAPECADELLLLSGRLPSDLMDILQRHPAEAALLLRQHFGDASPSPAIPTQVEAPYLPADLASAMTDWAIRSAQDTVLDPSCGDGGFLLAAATRLIALGAAPGVVVGQLHGYEADSEATARATQRLQLLTHVAPHLRCEDFLRVEPRSRLPFQRSGPPSVSAVLGALSAGDSSATARRLARRVSSEVGIALPEGAPPWVARIVHAASFARPDGRLALAVPTAFLTARYAADARSYLAQLFPSLTVVIFERPHPGLGEVVVVLGDVVGDAGVRSTRVADAASLRDALATRDPTRVAEGSLRWSAASLPTPALALLRSLRRDGVLRRLGDLVRVDAGIVTGANRVFLLDARAAEGVNREHLRPVLATAGGARGVIFRQTDWQDLQQTGRSCFILAIPPGASLNAG
jgi:adenine-specific DNA-methyltransferase